MKFNKKNVIIIKIQLKICNNYINLKGCVFLIKGYQFRDAIISGANNILNNKKTVDDLNIFPVPDGDTGTNMSLTISAASKVLAELPDSCDIHEVAKTAASSMLRGARGNSGVILSILFRGLSDGLSNLESADGIHLAHALYKGVDAAYGAVMKPTEGTMLTVSRVGAEYGETSSGVDASAIYVWTSVCKGAQKALEQTPELLPVLKKAGVVDAGGYGLCLIFEGMLSVFQKGEIIELMNVAEDVSSEDFSSKIAQFDEEINYTYCTEFIVIKNATEQDVKPLRAYLETLGDSVVVVDDEEIIKVHVHTENPGNALQKGLEYGELTNLKIENMREQNRMNRAKNAPKLDFVEPEEDYGFVSVSAGAGLEELFISLGASHIVSGGQTMNPSTNDIVAAVLATPAKTVYVLPNNKNIIMAAEQAVPMVTDRNVVIIPTKTIPQGLCAMMNFDMDADEATNTETMNDVIAGVETGLVTFAARDSEYGGHKIKSGDILGLVNGKMDYIEKKTSNACLKVVKAMANKNSSFITIIYGKDCTEEDATTVFNNVSSKYSNAEVTLVNGGQPVYHYIVSVE